MTRGISYNPRQEVNVTTMLRRGLPFLGMLILAVGSVNISCRTISGARDGTAVTVNAVRTEADRLATVRVFDDIESVLVTDIDDRSRRRELARETWEYDPRTTEITILEDLPLDDYMIHVTGNPRSPEAFVLVDIAPEPNLLVVIDGRAGIRGYDYTFDASDGHLVFRNGIDLRGTSWLVRYERPIGSTSIGQWDPERDERIAYIEAEHRRRVLDARFYQMDELWFLDGPDGTADPPALVKRRPRPEEIEAIKSHPVAIRKYRSGTSIDELNTELGFDTAVPETITLESLGREYTLDGKTIVEYVGDGSLTRELRLLYRSKHANEPVPVLDLILAADRDRSEREDGFVWVIGQDAVNLGTTVDRIRAWSIYTTNPDAEPEVVNTTSWSWTDGSVFFSLGGRTDDREIYEHFIRRFNRSRN